MKEIKYFTFVSIIVFVSIQSFAQEAIKSIEKINYICTLADPYVRKFSYNDSTGILKWVNKAGDITCEAILEDVSVEYRGSGSSYTVLFSCLDGSKCIECNYTGPVKESAITVNNVNAASEIVAEFKKIKNYTTVSVDKTVKDTVAFALKDVNESLETINKYCKQYDPYKRFFSFNENDRRLRWITGDRDIDCNVLLKSMKAYVQPFGSNFYVTFECTDGSTCINSSYSGQVKLTSITITDKTIAEAIVAEIKKLYKY